MSSAKMKFRQTENLDRLVRLFARAHLILTDIVTSINHCYGMQVTPQLTQIQR